MAIRPRRPDDQRSGDVPEPKRAPAEQQWQEWAVTALLFLLLLGAAALPYDRILAGASGGSAAIEQLTSDVAISDEADVVRVYGLHESVRPYLAVRDGEIFFDPGPGRP